MAKGNYPELQFGDEAETSAEKPKEASNKEAPKASLPALGEFTLLVCTLLLVIILFTVVITAWLNGSSLLSIVIRAVVTLLATGSLLALIARQVITGMAKAGMIPEEPEPLKNPFEPGKVK